MSQVYSTRATSLSRGDQFSSRTTMVRVAPAAVTGVVAQPAAEAAATPVAEVAPPAEVVEAPAPEQVLQFHLSSEGLVAPPPGLGGAGGTVTLSGRPGSVYTVSATLGGLKPHKDPAIRPALWLISDLTVPEDLAPADLAGLPQGAGLAHNQPGAVFTVDGNPPTYGKQSNTLSVAVSPGVFSQAGPDSWVLTARLEPALNQAFHPLAVLGPAALGNIDVALPSGTVARILTDLFMRPASVHPELSLRTQYPQRLAAIVQRVLSEPGAVAYLAPERFCRAAVTLEGIVRGTPRLMPTREACCLIANSRI